MEGIELKQVTEEKDLGMIMDQESITKLKRQQQKIKRLYACNYQE